MLRTIPETSPTRYLSGMAALNVPSDEGTGDWHTLGTFSVRNTKPLNFIAEDALIRALGRDGIEDRTADADRFGIPHQGRLWAATHVRAVVDLVVRNSLEGRSFAHVELDSWFNEVRHGPEIEALLRGARLSPLNMIQVSTWLSRQFR